MFYVNDFRSRNEREHVLRDARLITTRLWTSDLNIHASATALLIARDIDKNKVDDVIK